MWTNRYRYSMSLLALLLSAQFYACGVDDQPQDVITIQDDNTYEYRISLELVAVLGVGHEGNYLTNRSVVSVESRGYYYVGPTVEQGFINVYDNFGRFLNTIGGYGAGPGEIEDISRIAVSSEDTLYVYDNMLHRFNLYALNGLFIRSFHFPVIPQFMCTLEDGQIAVSAPIYTDSRASYQYHILDRWGKTRRSFEEVEARSPQASWSTLKPIAWSLSSESLLWSSEFRTYEVSLRDQRGRKVLILQRDVPWFKAWTERSPGTPHSTPPESIIKGMIDLGSDRLLTLSSVADSNWKPVNSERDATGHERFLPLEVMDTLYDSIIELIDIADGQVLASQRFEFMISDLVGRNRIYRARELDDGSSIREIYRINLEPVAGR